MKNPYILEAISRLVDVDLLLNWAMKSLDEAGIADTHLGVEIRLSQRCLNYVQSELEVQAALTKVLDPVRPKE